MHIRLVVLFLTFAIPAAAAEQHPLAVKALEQLDAFERDAWSYTRTTTDEDGTRVERHDASKPEGQRWLLLRVDGKAPTARQIEAFRKEKAEEEKRRKKGSDDAEGDVDRSSIRLVSETAQRATYSFKTKVSGGGMEAKFADTIAGTLVVNKDGGWAERFEIRSTEAVAPIPGVKVSAFRLTLTFQRHAPSREIVPEGMEMSMRGKAFLVKSLDQDRSARYSDFVRVR